MRQVLSAIVYLHQKNLIYGNLNPFVLLLEKDENIQEGLNLKLINSDLQSACISAKDPFIMTSSYFCSPSYFNGNISKNQDVWSYGILLSLLLAGQLPLFIQPSDHSSTLITQVLEGKFNFSHPIWSDVSDIALQFV